MPTDLELALQTGGVIEGETDLQKALREGGKAEPTEARGVAPFVSRAITTAAGAPVDIAAAGLSLIPGIDIEDPVGGRKSIERGFEALGTRFPEEEARPETPAEYIGAGIGETASLLVPFGKAAQMASKGVSGFTKIGGKVFKIMKPDASLISKVSNSVWEGIVKHPYLAGVSEITAGTGAGTGRYVGEEVYPDRPLVRPLAEIAGGVVGGLVPTAAMHTPTALVLRGGKKLIQKGALPFGEKGSRYRAGKFLKKQVVSPEETIRKVAEETIGDLPPVVASGEKRLAALYKQFRDADPVTDAEAVKKIGKSIYKLEQELRGLGYGAPEVMRNVTSKRIAAIELNMQKRVTDAMDNAQTKLNALPVAERRAKEAIIVRNELEKVMRSEFDKTKSLWADVSKGLDVNYSGTKKVYSDILDDLAIAQREDIPNVLRKSIITKKGEITTIKEMQGLRSKLLETQRMAGKEGKWNKARIAGDVSDALLDDMDKVVDDSLSIAIAGTRQFKERFERGIVGQILGKARTGAPQISPELTLDISIGRAGVRGAVDIEKVAITPEAVAATKRYMAKSFTEYVTDKGTKNFNVDKAQKWIRSNEAVLDKFPELRAQMDDIASAQKLADNTLALTTARKQKLQDPRISTSARFLKSAPRKEVENVFKSSNPTKETRELIRQARKDPTGEALEGLKGSYVDHIIETSSVGSYNDVGEQTLSGRTLQAFVNKNRGVIREVFSQEEINRIDRIGKELSKLEMAEKPGITVDMEMSDMASNFLRTVSRFGGAAVGRFASKTVLGGPTIQHPAYMSDIFKKYATHLSKDRAFQLVHEAITIDDGGKLLNALLLPLDKPQTQQFFKNLIVLNKRMNLWLIGTGSRVLDDIEQEIREDRQDLTQQIPEGSQSTLGGGQ